MNPKKIEKEGKQNGSISQEEESVSISILDAGDPLAGYKAKIKMLRKRIRDLKQKNSTLSQQVKFLKKREELAIEQARK